MQRNEDQCLVPWARYHGYMMGFENVVILDHASTSPQTCVALDDLERNGVTVVRLPASADYREKGRIVADALAHYAKDADFAFPIDCDEFLFCRDKAGKPSCSRNVLSAHLADLASLGGMFGIAENFLHILGQPGYFWSQPYQKRFFRGGECLSLDHGSHWGSSSSGDTVNPSRLAYAHFHFKPYQIDRKLTREKLKPWVNVDDLEAVRNFDGPGAHLRSHLLMSEDEFYQSLKPNGNAIYFEEMVKLFHLLGIDPDFSMAGEKIPQSADAIESAARALGLPWPLPPITMDSFEWTNFEHPLKLAP